MLQRISYPGLSLPRLYMAENKADIELARDNGVPYIVWKKGMEELVKSLLRPTLEKMFPGVNFNKVLGRKKGINSKVYWTSGHKAAEPAEHDKSFDAEAMLEAQKDYDDSVVDDVVDWKQPDENGEITRDVDIAMADRECTGGFAAGYNLFYHDGVSVYDYIGDLSSGVDIEVLQSLQLLPKFVGDIADCIKSNLGARMRWTEGYTKKLGYPLGKFTAPGDLPNLIIIDCSYSIPDGIAATMLTLADTLRSQCNAELIITAARSGYYPMDAELPSPQTLRDYYPRGNEAVEFFGILDNYIVGREFGHVISFGDNDNPGYFCHPDKAPNLNGTKVHQVHHYHTVSDYDRTGYARWVHEVCPDVEEFHDTSWAWVMD